MESLPVRRKPCLLRLRQNCPLRKLCRQKYGVDMDEDPPAVENKQNPTDRAEDCMDVDDNIDPETGEKAQG